MGCFDYVCGCGGKTCDHTGGQLWDSDVYIEVPLSDGTKIYLEGSYEEYGYVLVKMPIAADVQYVEYKFYLKEFEEYFEGWFDGEDEGELEDCLLANRAWTRSETVITTDKFGSEIKGFVERDCFNDMGDIPVSELTPEIVSKCKRAPEGLNLETADEKQKKQIAKLKSTIEFMQKELGRLNRP